MTRRPRSPLLLLALGVGALLGPGLGACGEPPSRAPSPASTSRQPPAVEAPWRGEGPLVLVSVWELECAGCAVELELALAEIEGVAAARADWESAEVRIELAEGTAREEAIGRIREAIHAAGRQVLGEDPVER